MVFESMRPTPNYRSIGIYGVRVTVAGTVRDPVPLRICDHPDLDERFPVVASAGGNWLIGWSNSTTSASTVRPLTSEKLEVFWESPQLTAKCSAVMGYTSCSF